MKRKRKVQTRSGTDALPPEVGLLLKKIEREPVPEKLLELALKLQDALAQRNRIENQAVPRPVRDRRSGQAQ